MPTLHFLALYHTKQQLGTTTTENSDMIEEVLYHTKQQLGTTTF